MKLTLETSALESLYGGQLKIRPIARRGNESIAHEAKPNGLLTQVEEIFVLE